MGLEEEVARLRKQNRRLKAVLLGFVAVFLLMAGGAISSAVHARALQARAMDAARQARAQAEAALEHARARQQEINAKTE